jgi:hypothetical protein
MERCDEDPDICPGCGLVWEERCGGMIREGVCTLPFGHDGQCGLADE